MVHNIHIVSSDRKRVQFRAPVRLIERADALADVLGEDRTDVLVTALREYLHEAAHDDALTREMAAAYYDDAENVDAIRAVLGTADAGESIRRTNEAMDVGF